MYSVLNTLSEYTYFSLSKNITSYAFLVVFKVVESLQCILKANSDKSDLMSSRESNKVVIETLCNESTKSETLLQPLSNYLTKNFKKTKS